MHTNRFRSPLESASTSAARSLRGWVFTPLAIAALVVVGTGCPGAGGQCAINDDCAAGELCLASTCSATCESDSECGTDETCSNGVCEAGTRDPDVGPGDEPEPSVGPVEPEGDAGGAEPDQEPDTGPDDDGGPGPEGGNPDVPPDDAGPGPGTPTPDDGGPIDNDGGPIGTDGGLGGNDGGPGPDGGLGGDDGGPVGNDGGPVGNDGGPVGNDGGPVGNDGGQPPVDAGFDAGPPPPTPPELTDVTAFSTRLLNAAVDTYVFDLVGVDPNGDPAVVFISVFNAADTAIVTDFELNANNFAVDGADFTTRISVSGFSTLGGGPGVRAELTVRDAAGLSAANGTSVALPGAPVLGGACPVPVAGSGFVPCPTQNVCTGAEDLGTCAVANTANPVLNPVQTLVRTSNEAGCVANGNGFPDRLDFTLTGTSQQRIVQITIGANEPGNLNNPSFPPAFDIGGSVCATADASGSVTFTVIDETGRVSNSAAGQIP